MDSTTEKVVSALTTVLVNIRATYESALSFHWRAGCHADHLLFERVNNEVYELIDKIAEQVVSITDKPELVETMVLSHAVTEVFRQIDVFPVFDPEQFVDAQRQLTLETKIIILYLMDTIFSQSTRYTGFVNLLEDVITTFDSHIYLLRGEK